MSRAFEPPYSVGMMGGYGRSTNHPPASRTHIAAESGPRFRRRAAKRWPRSGPQAGVEEISRRRPRALTTDLIHESLCAITPTDLRIEVTKYSDGTRIPCGSRLLSNRINVKLFATGTVCTLPPPRRDNELTRNRSRSEHGLPRPALVEDGFNHVALPNVWTSGWIRPWSATS
jgi:hypothetical protein